MLKIYKHIKAQAQIKVKMGETKEGDPIFQNVKFTGGRVLGTEKGTVGGAFHTSNEALQQAIENRPDFGKTFFIDHKIQADKEVMPDEKDFKIYPGIDTINRVKNILKSDFGDKIKGEDLRGTGEMLKFCKRIGAAFPDFFTVEQGHFAELLDAKAEAKAKGPDEEEEPQVKGDVPKENAKAEVKEETPEEHEPEDPDTPEEDTEVEEVEVDPEELRAMLRRDLDEKAREFGVENPEALPNKEAVVQAILNS